MLRGCVDYSVVPHPFPGLSSSGSTAKGTGGRRAGRIHQEVVGLYEAQCLAHTRYLTRLWKEIYQKERMEGGREKTGQVREGRGEGGGHGLGSHPPLEGRQS